MSAGRVLAVAFASGGNGLVQTAPRADVLHSQQQPAFSVRCCFETTHAARTRCSRRARRSKALAANSDEQESVPLDEEKDSDPALSGRQPESRGSQARAGEGEKARDFDARGFVVPRVGEIVMYPGRWPGQDAVAKVEAVQFVDSRLAYIVDVREMRSVGPQLFAEVSVSSRRQNTASVAKWKDVGEVRIAREAKYVPRQNAYLVEQARDGYQRGAARSDGALDEATRQRYLKEYAALKDKLLRIASISCAALTAGVALATAFDLSLLRALVLGELSGLAYLYLLTKDVDRLQVLGSEGESSRKPWALVPPRLALVTVPFLALAAVHSGTSSGTTEGVEEAATALKLVAVPKSELLLATLGFLTYKIPVLQQAGSPLVQELSTAKPTGMVSMGVVQAARVLSSKDSASGSNSASTESSSGERGTQEQEAAADGGAASLLKPLVICGPSGVGKSTLLRRLVNEFEGKFAFCVSHTTRAKRAEEVNGVDYFFISDEQFDAMQARGEFIESANVHGCKYGTALKSVRDITALHQICVLDVDIQGVEKLRAMRNFEGRFVWIGPPSMDALEARLRERGSETEESIRTRLSNAVLEMSIAATKGYFDHTIINEDVSTAYEELITIVRPVLMRATW